MESFVEACEQGCASGDHDGIIQGFPHVDIAILDTIYNHLVNTWPLESDLVWAEQDLRSLEFFLSELNDLAVGHVIIRKVLFFLATGIHLVLIGWRRDVALHLLDLLHDFELGCRVEYMAGSSKK